MISANQSFQTEPRGFNCGPLGYDVSQLSRSGQEYGSPRHPHYATDLSTFVKRGFVLQKGSVEIKSKLHFDL